MESMAQHSSEAYCPRLESSCDEWAGEVIRAVSPPWARIFSSGQKVGGAKSVGVRFLRQCDVSLRHPAEQGTTDTVYGLSGLDVISFLITAKDHMPPTT